MIAEGRYVARAVRGELTAMGSAQTPLVLASFRTSDGEDVEWQGWLTDKAVDRTLEALRVCGWTGDDVRELPGLDANEVEIEVQHEEFKGRIYARVRWVNALGSGSRGAGAGLSAETAAAIATGLRGKAVLSRQKAGERPAPKPRPAPQSTPAPGPFDSADRKNLGGGIADDDIPFARLNDGW